MIDSHLECFLSCEKGARIYSVMRLQDLHVINSSVCLIGTYSYVPLEFGFEYMFGNIGSC